LHYLSLDHEIAFLPPPSRPVFSSSTLRPHFNNNAAFCERRILFFLFPTSSFLTRQSLRNRQHIIAIQPLESNNQASLAVLERISACPMNY
ncbi:unnamed protein product, partial [Fusarium graminearum]